MTTNSYGIHKIGFYSGPMFLDIAGLARARGGDLDSMCPGMMLYQRSVQPPWEDPVTMAVNAAKSTLTAVDLASVRLLLVASESGPDQEKALSTWIQRHLGLRDDVRNVEVKGACYAGLASVRLAMAWLAFEAEEGETALVICTDQSRQHFGEAQEFVMGGGSVALLLSKNPDLFAFDHGLSGVFTHEVADLTRPTSKIEAGHGDTSLLSYMDAAATSFDRYREVLLNKRGIELKGLSGLKDWLPFQIYHSPFGGITKRVHRNVVRTVGERDAAAFEADFATRIFPTLVHGRRMGSVYASSIFISMLGAIDSFGAEAAGRRVGVFSYGSGSMGEYFSGVFGDESLRVAQSTGAGVALDARIEATVAEYEAAEAWRYETVDWGDFSTPLDGYRDLYTKSYEGRGRLIFEGQSKYVRQYRWS